VSKQGVLRQRVEEFEVIIKEAKYATWAGEPQEIADHFSENDPVLAWNVLKPTTHISPVICDRKAPRPYRSPDRHQVSALCLSGCPGTPQLVERKASAVRASLRCSPVFRGLSGRRRTSFA
jgi:hypothetical protein